MRRTTRFLVPWLLPLLLVALPTAPGSAPNRSHDGLHSTEPTLPLIIDMDLSRRPGGDPAATTLRVDLLAGAAIEELSLALDLPDGVVPAADDTPVRGRQPDLRAGERRSFVLPLQMRAGALHDVRLRASFRLADGRTFSVMQGATLPDPSPDRTGRRHAGAYEVFGVPLSDVRR